MSNWNYRLISHPDAGFESGRVLIVHEVFYDEKGNVIMWNDGAKILGETKKAIMDCIKTMKRDIDKAPILMIEDLEKRAKTLKK